MRRCKKDYPKILCWSVLNFAATAAIPNKISSKLIQFFETFWCPWIHKQKCFSWKLLCPLCSNYLGCCTALKNEAFYSFAVLPIWLWKISMSNIYINKMHLLLHVNKDSLQGGSSATCFIWTYSNYYSKCAGLHLSCLGMYLLIGEQTTVTLPNEHNQSQHTHTATAKAKVLRRVSCSPAERKPPTVAEQKYWRKIP